MYFGIIFIWSPPQDISKSIDFLLFHYLFIPLHKHSYRVIIKYEITVLQFEAQ